MKLFGRLGSTLFALIVSSCYWLAGISAAGVNVPVVSACHQVKKALPQGRHPSHPGYPDVPYSPGYQCRIVINVPTGRHAQVSIGGNTKGGNLGLRPWDFAIIVDGSVADKLNFICDVEKYKQLGASGEAYSAVVQKYLTNGVRTIKSQSTTIVVDFCVHTYDKDLNNRKGFEITYTSTPVSVSNSDPGAPLVPILPAHNTSPPNTIQLESSTSRPSPRKTCGQPQNPPSNNPNSRIVHGVEARENSWPWICALVQKPRQHFCGCTLIADRWIVTAGHCIDASSDEDLKFGVEVYLGVENLKAATANNKFGIIRVIRHERYNTPVGSTSNDIALMELDRVIVRSNDLMPACLPNNTVFQKPFVQTARNGRRICYVGGWGRLYDEQRPADGGKIGAGSDALQQVAVEVMSVSTCKAFSKDYAAIEAAFCGGFDNGYFDSCQGDSGGPLVCDEGNGRWSLFGIVSWGLGCAVPRAPGVYTDVPLMKDWITSKIGSYL